MSVDSERESSATQARAITQGVTDLITSGSFEVAPGLALDARGFAKLLAAVVHHGLGRESSNLVGAHFYSFGEAAETVAWMNREIISGDERPELSLG